MVVLCSRLLLFAYCCSVACLVADLFTRLLFFTFPARSSLFVDLPARCLFVVVGFLPLVLFTGAVVVAYLHFVCVYRCSCVYCCVTDRAVTRWCGCCCVCSVVGLRWLLFVALVRCPRLLLRYRCSFVVLILF